MIANIVYNVAAMFSLFNDKKKTNMNYKKVEKEIVKATHDFAKSNNVYYDVMTENMILNALRELNKLHITDVSGSYSVNDMDDAYDKGFKDAMVKYRE
jgi:hypothetical protein